MSTVTRKILATSTGGEHPLMLRLPALVHAANVVASSPMGIDAAILLPELLVGVLPEATDALAATALAVTPGG